MNIIHRIRNIRRSSNVSQLYLYVWVYSGSIVIVACNCVVTILYPCSIGRLNVNVIRCVSNIHLSCNVSSPNLYVVILIFISHIILYLKDEFEYYESRDIH